MQSHSAFFGEVFFVCQDVWENDTLVELIPPYVVGGSFDFSPSSTVVTCPLRSVFIRVGDVLIGVSVWVDAGVVFGC